LGNLKKNLILNHYYKIYHYLYTGFPQKLWKNEGGKNGRMETKLITPIGAGGTQRLPALPGPIAENSRLKMKMKSEGGRIFQED